MNPERVQVDLQGEALDDDGDGVGIHGRCGDTRPRRQEARGVKSFYCCNEQGGTKLWSPRPNREVMRLSEPYQ